MKKRIITLALLIAVGQTTFAQSVNDFFDNYKREKNAEMVSIPSIVMTFIKLFMGNDPQYEIAKKINSVSLLDIEDCTDEVKQRFRKDAAHAKFNDYEELIRVKNEEENVRILVKQKKSVIRDLIILTSGEECALVHLKGKIKMEDISAMMNKPDKE